MTAHDDALEHLRGLCKDDESFEQLRALLARQAEQERLKLARFDALLAQTADAVHLNNLEGYYIDVNDWGAEMIGYTREDMLGGMHFRDIVLPEEAPQAVSVIKRLLAGGHIPPYERRVRRKDGQTMTVEINIQLIRDEQGQPMALQSLVRDLSERKKRETQVIESNRLRTALAYAEEMNALKAAMMVRLSHEFRTPLTIIQTSAKLLESYYERMTAEARAQQVAKINQEIRRLDEMMSDISLAVRWQNRHDFIIPLPFDFMELVQRVADKARQSYASVHELALDMQVQTCRIMADETLIEAIVKKLLQNAVKFSPPGSVVGLHLSLMGDYVQLVVQDQGIGIPPDEQERIFEAFYRASNIGEVGGMGIGLTIVRQAVEAHGGSIRLESESGRGTRVQIVLPILPNRAV